MKQMLDRLALVLALIIGVTSVHAQNNQVQDARRQPPAGNGKYDADARYARPDSAPSPADRHNAQPSGERQGRLTPEERQTLRRQIDEAGHDLYKRKR
jgi:hypothetical protein